MKNKNSTKRTLFYRKPPEAEEAAAQKARPGHVIIPPMPTQTQTSTASRSKLTLNNPVAWGLILAFLIATAVTSWLTYKAARDIFAKLPFEIAPSLQTGQYVPPTATANALGTPAPTSDTSTTVQQPSGPQFQEWGGASRVNILFLGLDYGDWSEERKCPCRSDTMIVFTIDPTSRSIGILNVPRDLWVDMPGLNINGKINQAYFYGDAYKLPSSGPGLPGDGPGMAMRTVEQFLGVPIQYYVQLDFFAFEDFIDEIGGIEIEITQPITEVTPVGGHMTDYQPGQYTFDGPTALAYARSRKTSGGDFDRARRQQQVILAIRDRVLEPSRFTTLLSKAPIIYDKLAAGIHTNMTLDQAIRLAWLAQQIPAENIQRGIISVPDQVALGTVIDQNGTKMDVLIPVPDKIRELRDSIFVSASPASPVSSEDPKKLMQTEAARVQIKNGSSASGLAAQTRDYLVAQGINVTEATNADTAYATTQIIDYTGKPYTLNFLIKLMGIQQTQVYSSFDPNSSVDVVVILGDDWANKNPMP